MSDCDGCTVKGDAECAICLGLDTGSAPGFVIDGAPLDAQGWPILPDARVFVPRRPGLAGEATVPAFSGFVISANSERVDIQEMGTFHYRVVRPAELRVQKGTTKAATEHRTAAAALKGTTQTKRGLRKIAVEAQGKVIHSDASSAQSAPPARRRRGAKRQSKGNKK
jgi:hypothetical protein